MPFGLESKIIMCSFTELEKAERQVKTLNAENMDNLTIG